MDTASSQLLLEIDVESDPISGAVSAPGGVPHRFSGWIELVSAIEGARASSGLDITLGWMPGAKDPRDVYLAAQMVPGHWGNRGTGLV